MAASLRRRGTDLATRPERIVIPFGGLVLATLVAACASAAAPPTAQPPTLPPSSTPAGAVLTAETRGGLYPEGACSSTIVVDRDGRIRVAAKPPSELGTVDPAALAVDHAALAAEIAATDFAEVRTHRFTGTCPTAYDGQEVVFTFATSGGSERLASFEVVIDPAAPLFRAIAAALGPPIAMPASPSP